jgi:hypothetical protein
MGIRVCEHCAAIVDIEKSRLCSKCSKKTGRREDYATPWERVAAHAVDYALAETNQDARRAREALRIAAKDWVRKGAR